MYAEQIPTQDSNYSWVRVCAKSTKGGAVSRPRSHDRNLFPLHFNHETTLLRMVGPMALMRACCRVILGRDAARICIVLRKGN